MGHVARYLVLEYRDPIGTATCKILNCHKTDRKKVWDIILISDAFSLRFKLYVTIIKQIVVLIEKWTHIPIPSAYRE